MLGFYVLLEDPDANVIIALAVWHCTVHCCSWVFWKSCPTLYCWSAQAPGFRRRRSSQ